MSRLTLILGVLVVTLLASLGLTLHLWRGAVADAATWQQSARQLQQTVKDSEAQNAALRAQMRTNQEAITKNAKAQQAITARARDRQARLAKAQSAASAAYQNCRALPLPDSVARILQHGAADRQDEN